MFFQGTPLDDGQYHHFWKWTNNDRNDHCLGVSFSKKSKNCIKSLIFSDPLWMIWVGNTAVKNQGCLNPLPMEILVTWRKSMLLGNLCKTLIFWNIFLSLDFFWNCSADIDVVISESLFKTEDDEARKKAMLGFIELKYRFSFFFVVPTNFRWKTFHENLKFAKQN